MNEYLPLIGIVLTCGTLYYYIQCHETDRQPSSLKTESIKGLNVVLNTIKNHDLKNTKENKISLDTIEILDSSLTDKRATDEDFKMAMVNLATHYDTLKFSKDNGMIIMALFWLWSQVQGDTNKVAHEKQNFLGHYLPAAFLYGGFKGVVEKLLSQIQEEVEH